VLRAAGTVALGAAMAVVALGAAMAVAAAAFGSPSLFVPGFALIFLGLAAATWVPLAARGATLERTIGPATVEEERGWPIEVRARTGLLPAPGGELREPLLRGGLPMAGRQSRRLRVNVTFERRGRRSLAPARLTLRDPLGLVERELEAGAGQQVLVLPRIEPVLATGGGAGGAADASSGARPAEVAAEVEMESLRPYREGAPASRIHWPTVARTGTLMERRLLADSDSRPLVVLDPTNPGSPDLLDMAVRAAASLCVHLAKGGGCSLMLPGDRRATDLDPELGGWPPLHARLALIEAGAPMPAVRLESRRGGIFWVTANASGRPPRALARVQAARYLVSPAPGEGRAAFTVAGCTGVALGRSARRAA
jgi:uncharacterized protein (DUF58 family)